ncbi:hypothetical protein GCM10027422_27440 [Hymenobacter arcticus]
MKTRLLACASLLALTACMEEKPIDYLTPYPPFALRVSGHSSQAVWGAREQFTTASVYYHGKPLQMSGIGDTLYPRFNWWQQVPGGRLLLGLLPRDGLANPCIHHLYLLEAPAGRLHLQGLGRCPMDDPLTRPQPRTWLTLDTLGLLIAAPDFSDKPEKPPFRFVDLQAPATFTPLPAAPTQADGKILEPVAVAWSPDHRQVARAFARREAIPYRDKELAETTDRRTGRHHDLQVLPDPHAANTATLYPELRWQPAGGTYRLVRK